MKVDAGPADLAPGGVRVVPTSHLPPPWRSVIVARSADTWVGYWNVCRHLPIPLDGGLGVLEPGPDWACSTHGARFRVADGLCTEGPCVGAALYPLKVEVEAGRVWVHAEVPAP